MKPKFQPLKVMAAPIWAGKHPCHDNRYIATADAEWSEVSKADGEMEEPTCELETGFVVAKMTDLQFQKQWATLLALSPLMANCLQRIVDSYDAPHRVDRGEAILEARALLASLNS